MKEITVEATDNNLSKVLSFIDEILEETCVSLRVRMQIEVAVEEIFVNIAHYAYAPDTGTARIQAVTASDPKSVSITFIDSGKPYDPLSKADPDVTLSAEKRDIGGLGIYMVKKSMDSLKYEYLDGHNVFTITKML